MQYGSELTGWMSAEVDGTLVVGAVPCSVTMESGFLPRAYQIPMRGQLPLGVSSFRGSSLQTSLEKMQHRQTGSTFVESDRIIDRTTAA